jgi:hypothetical protein
MNRPLRLALVVLGIAAVIYGTSTLTGGWLGTPPWWQRQENELIRGADEPKPGEPQVWTRVVWKPTEDRELASLGVVLAGVGIVALSRSGRALRGTIVGVGLVAVLYGTASLTGNWLSTPPWWLELQFRSIPMESTGPFSGRGREASPEEYVWNGPRKYREAWSWGVVVAGVGLAAFGAWPRRRLRAAP